MEEGPDTVGSDEEHWYVLNNEDRSDETESEMPVEGLLEDKEQSQADSDVDMKCHQMWIDDDEGASNMDPV